MRQANTMLRAARERMRSPYRHGHPMSRADLARALNAYTSRVFGRTGAADERYIGKLERGEVRWPNAQYRAALRHVLGASDDADLGLRRAQEVAAGHEHRHELDRQQFLLAVLGTGAAAVVGYNEAPWCEPTPTTNRVTSEDVERVRLVAATYAGWDHLWGGELAREGVLVHVRSAAALLRAGCSEQLHGPLHGAVAYLAHTAAFAAFDACDHNEARKLFGFALRSADEAGEWHIRAKILSSMARQEIWTGNAEDGLTFAELGLVRADRLTPAERAMLHTARARAFAKKGMVQETLRAVGEADDAFARHDPSGDTPPWMAYYDCAQHAGDTGHALFDLAIAGGRTRAPSPTAERAATRLAASVAGHLAAHSRSRTISSIKYASLTIATGEREEGARLGLAALAAAAPLRSRRALHDLRELQRHAAVHSRTPQVGDLHDALAGKLA